MLSNSDHLDPDAFSSPIRDEECGKWRVFKERVERKLKPKWVVWDEYYGESLFDTGEQALAFVHRELTNRRLAGIIRQRQEQLS